MVSFAILAGLIAGIAQEANETVKFHHKESGFIYNYPKDWSYTKLRNADRFLFSADGQTTAELDIFGLAYSGEVDSWMEAQRVTASNQKRSVEKQWQEEILGVPLLLTQTSWVNEGREMVSESGMIYATTQRKFIYRLTSPKSSFDMARYAWRTVLQSLNTDDGVPPRPFDRTKGPGITEIGGAKRTIWKENDKGSKKPEKLVIGDLAVETMAAGKKTLLRYPTPWTVEKDGNKYVFLHPQVTGKVIIEALSSLDSLPPGRQLIQNSSQSLEGFMKVQKREEPLPAPSKSGMVMTYVYREGQSKDGYLLTLDAVGSNSANEYWTAIWQSTDNKTGRKQLQTVMELVRVLSVELAP